MPAAQDDLRAAYAYYAERDPAAPDRVIGVILHAANGLAQFPLLGRPGVVPGTRERIVSRYPYRIVSETIEVLRIIPTKPRHDMGYTGGAEFWQTQPCLNRPDRYGRTVRIPRTGQ